jgi:hypothetical protein
MKPQKLTQLTEQELLSEQQKAKTIIYSYSIIIGMLIGITIYSTVKKGFGIFTFLPLFFIPFMFILQMNYRAVKKEIMTRKSQ